MHFLHPARPYTFSCNNQEEDGGERCLRKQIPNPGDFFFLQGLSNYVPVTTTVSFPRCLSLSICPCISGTPVRKKQTKQVHNDNTPPQKKEVIRHMNKMAMLDFISEKKTEIKCNPD